ncbi:MAG: hypothetical protein AAF633_10805 [Chloroflexota bacterium]
MNQLNKLKAAAFNGHAQLDRVAARREALVELLSHGQPIAKSVLLAKVEEKIGPCWGKRPSEALLRDLNALRLGGIRIGYSRRKEAEGYYLKYPALEADLPTWVEPVNATYLEMVQKLKPEEKLARGFASAQFALTQRRLILRRQEPEQSDEMLDQQARLIVYRADSKPWQS